MTSHTRPTYLLVRNPINHAIGVVRNKKGTIWMNGQAHWTAKMASVIIDEKSCKEIIKSRWLTVFEPQPNDFITYSRTPVPRSSESNKCIVTVIFRKLIACIKFHF